MEEARRARDDALALVEKYQEELHELQERMQAAEQRLSLGGAASAALDRVPVLEAQLQEQVDLVAKLRRNLSESAGSSLKIMQQLAQLKKDLAARDVRIAHLSATLEATPMAAPEAHDCASDPRCAAAARAAAEAVEIAIENARQAHSDELMRVEIDAGARCDAEAGRAARALEECDFLRAQLRASVPRAELDAALRAQEDLRAVIADRDRMLANAPNTAASSAAALAAEWDAKEKGLRREVSEARAALADREAAAAALLVDLDAMAREVRERTARHADAVAALQSDLLRAQALNGQEAQAATALSEELEAVVRARDGFAREALEAAARLKEATAAHSEIVAGLQYDLLRAQAKNEQDSARLTLEAAALRGELDAALRARDGFAREAQDAAARLKVAAATHEEAVAAMRIEMDAMDQLRGTVAARDQELALSRADAERAIAQLRESMESAKAESAAVAAAQLRSAFEELERLRAAAQRATERERELEEAAAAALRAVAAVEEESRSVSQREVSLREQAAASERRLEEALRAAEEPGPGAVSKLDELQRFNEEVLGLLETERNERLALEERAQNALTDLATERGSHMVTLRQLEEQKQRAAELEARVSIAKPSSPPLPQPPRATPSAVTSRALPKLQEMQRMISEVIQEASSAADQEQQLADLREELRRAKERTAVDDSAPDPFGRSVARGPALAAALLHLQPFSSSRSHTESTVGAFQNALLAFLSGPLDAASEAVFSRAVNGLLRRMDSDAVRRDLCKLRDNAATLHRIVGVFESDLQRLLRLLPN